jgi:hypothetical protein
MIGPDACSAIVRDAFDGANPTEVAGELAVWDGDIPDRRASVVGFLRNVANALEAHRWST